MISPFCPKCRAVILPGRGECPECQEPVRDRPGVTDSLRKVEAPSTRGDLFCPSCHGLILNADTRCSKCGMILTGLVRQDQTRGRTLSEGNSRMFTELATQKDQKLTIGLLAIDRREEDQWREFLTPDARELENEFFDIKTHEYTKHEDKEKQRAAVTEFFYFNNDGAFPIRQMGPEDINACAARDPRPGKSGYVVIYTLGHAVFDRLMGGILSAADLQKGGGSKLKMPLPVVLKEVLHALKKIGHLNTQNALKLLDKKLEYLIAEAEFPAGRDIAKWISRWTIAHEVGHVVLKHCDPHPADKNREAAIGMEYDADKFANLISSSSAHREYTFMGGLVNTLGMIARSGQKADRSSPTHPAPLDRFDDLFKKTPDSADEFSKRFNINRDELYRIAESLMRH